MRFYNQQHKFYCGIDLYARKMYVCIIDQACKTKIHRNLKTDPELLFDTIFTFLEDVVIGVECMFFWYWIADFCTEPIILFVLGHALYDKILIWASGHLWPLAFCLCQGAPPIVSFTTNTLC